MDEDTARAEELMTHVLTLGSDASVHPDRLEEIRRTHWVELLDAYWIAQVLDVAIRIKVLDEDFIHFFYFLCSYEYIYIYI